MSRCGMLEYLERESFSHSYGVRVLVYGIPNLLELTTVIRSPIVIQDRSVSDHDVQRSVSKPFNPVLHVLQGVLSHVFPEETVGSLHVVFGG